MSECEYIEKCPMFRIFILDDTKAFWADRYCRIDDGGSCARKALRQSGNLPEEIPASLLPNGEHLRTVTRG
jgi:hypothetical protein